VKFKDITDGLTVHEEVDESPACPRRIIVDSPDEKKQAMIEIRGKRRQGAAQVPTCRIHAHLMVEDASGVRRRGAREDPRETTKTKDITGGLPRLVSCSRRASARDRCRHLGDRRHRAHGRGGQGQRR